MFVLSHEERARDGEPEDAGAPPPYVCVPDHLHVPLQRVPSDRLQRGLRVPALRPLGAPGGLQAVKEGH